MRTSYLLACGVVMGCAALPLPPPVPLPSSTPAQLGKLVVVESMQAHNASNLVLSYTNDTEVDLRDVRLECTLLDGANRVVNSDNIEIAAVAQGAEVTKKLRIRDVHTRATRVECEIAAAKPDALRAEAQ